MSGPRPMEETVTPTIQTAQDIIDFIERHSRSRDKQLIGMEYERIGVDRRTGRGIPYYEGVEKILGEVANRDGWETGIDNGHIIYLQKGAEAFTLEPGGQTEYSSSPEPTIARLISKAQRAGKLLDDISAERDILYIGIGYQPFSSIEELEWVPKTRYNYMRPYLADKGELAHYMMKMTAGCQVALDYSDTTDAMRKLRAAALCTPVAQALFASSAIGEGDPLGFQTYRSYIWTKTDPARCDIPDFMISPSASIADYVEWLMDMPLMFLERGGVYSHPGGKTLRRLLSEGGVTTAELETIMTQAFPEVRIKTFIEIRSVDSPRPALLSLVPCFWSSILYGDIEGIFKLFGTLTREEFLEMRNTAFRQGLQGKFKDRTMQEWALDLLALAEDSCTCRVSLNLLRRRAEDGITPADEALRLWEQVKNPAEFVERWARYDEENRL